MQLIAMQLNAQHDPALQSTVLILDNNVARPDGGFGTRYPWFALIGVNPIPSPTDTDALGVVDVGLFLALAHLMRIREVTTVLETVVRRVPGRHSF